MRQTFEIPLDIPDVTIEDVTTNRIGHIEITVKSTVEGTPCHRCGKMTTQLYGEDREITLRHLPILGRKTFRLFGISRGVGLLYYQQVISTYELSNLLRRESAVGQTFEIPLDIPDVTIESVATNRIGHIEMTVQSTVEGTPCRQCGKMTTKGYGEDREIT